MQHNKNKEIARRWLEELFNQGDFSNAESIVAPDVVFENPPVSITGIDAVKGLATSLRTAFPDLHFTIEDEIEEREKVATRWRLRGTQRAEFRGNPPTHRQFDVSGIDIFEIVEGRVRRVWVNMDLLGQALQLGWIPSP